MPDPKLIRTCERTIEEFVPDFDDLDFGDAAPPCAVCWRPPPSQMSDRAGSRRPIASMSIA
jgi:hypothetical protein